VGVRTYPQIVAPVSRPAVLAASKPPGVVGAGLSAATDARQPLWRAALQNSQFTDKLLVAGLLATRLQAARDQAEASSQQHEHNNGIE